MIACVSRKSLGPIHKVTCF